MSNYNWQSEVLTPSSQQQALDFANMRRAQSPDGRFALRYLRNSEYEVDKGWNPDLKWTLKLAAWLITAAFFGGLFSRLWM